MKKALEMASTVLVAAAAALLLWTQVETRWLRRRPQPRAPRDVTGLTIEAIRVRHSRGTGAVALVEFTDYECPFCGRHARDTSPRIDKELVRTGAIRHVLFNFPLERHTKARKAGEAAECAARQGRYWEMHERLFSETTSFGDEELARLAEALGLDRLAFARCLAGEAAGDIMADLAEGKRLGVSSTPTFFVGIVQGDGSIQLAKQLSGARPFEEFRKLVDDVSGIIRKQD